MVGTMNCDDFDGPEASPTSSQFVRRGDKKATLKK